MNAPHTQSPHSQNASADGSAARQTEDLLGFDLVSLTSSAAQLRAKQIAFAHEGHGEQTGSSGDAQNELSYASFQALVHEYAAAMSAFGLQPGERILVTGCITVQSLAAVIAGLASGLDTAVAGVHLDSADIGAFAKAAGACALITDAGAEDTGAVQQVLTAAAQAENIRLVISLSNNPADGTVPVQAAAGAKAEQRKPGRSARIITRNMRGAPVLHSQQSLICAGLDFIANARLSAGAAILSTIIPASFAGLVCGPIAGLLTGAPTILHAPFDSQTLANRIAQDGPVQLIAPAAIGAHISDAPFCNDTGLSALVLLTRFEGNPASLTPPGLPAIRADGVDIIDLLAYDEVTAIARIRGDNGLPAMPLERNHTIHMGGREILAVSAVTHMLENNGVRTTTVAFDGAAVSKGNWKFYDSAE